MPTKQSRKPVVEVRPWSKNDLSLLERLASGPRITGVLGRDAVDEPVTLRHERYLQSRDPGRGPVMVILSGVERTPVGTIGYWPRVWHGQHLWELSWRVLSEQEEEIAAQAIALVARKIRADGTLRFLHAFPRIGDAARNKVLIASGFERLEEVLIDNTPGEPLVCNHYRIDLFERVSKD